MSDLAQLHEMVTEFCREHALLPPWDEHGRPRPPVSVMGVAAIPPVAIAARQPGKVWFPLGAAAAAFGLTSDELISLTPPKLLSAMGPYPLVELLGLITAIARSGNEWSSLAQTRIARFYVNGLAGDATNALAALHEAVGPLDFALLDGDFT